MRKTKTDTSIFLLVFILLLLAGGVAAAVYNLRGDPVGEALSGDRVINVLYVIEKEQSPLCTYVLMYYPATKRAAIFDIPGNLGLLIKQINRVDRIDTVYDPRRISGFENEIEGLLGIDINFSIVFDVVNLGKLVDLIEGVEVFIPLPLIEGGRTLFTSGLNRLDGEKSVLYALYETPDEDNDMPVQRRRHFFLRLLKRQGEMNETLKKHEVSNLYQSFLKTNIQQRTRSRLDDEFTHIDTGRINIQPVGGIMREVSGQMLLIPYYDGDTIKDSVRQTLASLTRPIEDSIGRIFTVEVLNGTSVNGLAGRTAELLRSSFGLDVISVGNADHSNYEKTVVIDHSGDEDAVKAFAEEILHCDNIFMEAPLRKPDENEFNIQNFEYRSDFTLIIGKDFNGRFVTRN